MKCDNCRYKKMCYRRFNPIGDKYSHTDNCEHYEEYEQRPHGEWIFYDNYGYGYADIYKCSRCSWIKDGFKPSFCENCGADMREGDEK